jgi:hypothetical protein
MTQESGQMPEKKPAGRPVRQARKPRKIEKSVEKPDETQNLVSQSILSIAHPDGRTLFELVRA